MKSKEKIPYPDYLHDNINSISSRNVSMSLGRNPSISVDKMPPILIKRLENQKTPDLECYKNSVFRLP